MSAFIVADITPTDIDSLKKYSEAAGPTLEKYNGKFLAKGPIETLTGDDHSKMKIILEFPDQDSANNWYKSDEYQALIPLRDKGMDAVFHLIKP
ncbi:MAG: hypothetical protein ACJAYF_000396 [Arenicella sp.]|jgi:uncharacterized protein (DUF1330 family)